MIKRFFLKNLYKSLLNKIYNPFLIINLKPMLLKINKSDKCLVIAPHPDDESIGCGGIISLYPNNFDVLCLTHGDIDDVRYSEMRRAMEYAGINKLEMLNLKDKNIISGKNEFNKINISNYDYIFIPYIFDQHKDHKAVSILLNEKLKEYKSNLKIAFYEVWSTINMPQYYVDISSVVEKKKTMINFHNTQVSVKNYADKIIGLNSYRGMLNNIKAAECFSILSVKDFQKIVSKILLYIE